VTDHADNERLLAIAGAISDGRQVEWPRLAGPVDAGDDQAIVEELRLLQQLSSAIAATGTWDGFEVGEVIGQGAFGTVYRGFDTQLEREIAVKITEAPGALFDPDRAVHEARLLARVRHPNVVTIYGAERRDDAVAVSMELIRGVTLHDLIARQGPMSAVEAATVGVAVCGAVAAVHGAGLLHGDIKAHNVMREQGGRLVLMDFGTGRRLTEAPGPGGDVAGTPLYLAPEVFLGHPRTVRSDTYSLGVLLFYLVTGTYPVDGSTASVVRQGHTNRARRRLRDVRPDLPKGFVSIVEQALADGAGQRFGTAGELEAALEGFVSPQRRVRSNGTRRLSPRGTSLILVSGVVLVMSVGLTVPASRTWLRSVLAGSSPAIPERYRVEASMHRVDPSGSARLRAGERLRPGDRLFMRLQASVPLYVYVVNEDDRGNVTLLFPLPGTTKGPLPVSMNTLPGEQARNEVFWQVTSPGVREYFVIFASPQPLSELEKVFAALPPPRFDVDVVTQLPLPESVVSGLRSVGGLVAGSSPNRLSARYSTPLPDEPESVTGAWIRRITFDNSGQ